MMSVWAFFFFGAHVLAVLIICVYCLWDILLKINTNLQNRRNTITQPPVPTTERSVTDTQLSNRDMIFEQSVGVEND